jgi:hypothetical protein
MFYTGYAGPGERGRIGMASSVDGIDWMRSSLNPMLDHGVGGSWDMLEVERPSIVRVGGEFLLYYHSETGAGASIGSVSSHSIGTGELVSVPFGMGISGLGFESLSWSSVEPSNTLISLAYRTSEDNATWSDWSEERTSSPVDLSSLGTTARWIQWRATLVSLDGMYTPILSDVTVSYISNTATAPDLMSPSDGSWTNDGTPTFSWTFDDLEGDTQTAFVVEIEDNSSFSAIDYTSGVVASSDESWTVTSELAQGIWYWRVRTQESNGSWSGNCTVWSFEVDTPPSAPEGLVVEPGEQGVLELTWDANQEDDVQGYNIFRSSSSGGSYDKINEGLVVNTSYSDPGLSDGSTFYYTVTAVDLRNQESLPSLEASGTTVGGMDFLGEYWWILLLIALLVIALIILVVGRKKPKEVTPEEVEPTEEEEMAPEPRETEMTDEERLQKLERSYQEGLISEDTYNELKKRYGGEPD